MIDRIPYPCMKLGDRVAPAGLHCRPRSEANCESLLLHLDPCEPRTDERACWLLTTDENDGGQRLGSFLRGSDRDSTANSRGVRHSFFPSVFFRAAKTKSPDREAKNGVK